MRVIYVTGVSCAGKTTVAQQLQAHCPASRHVVDIDGDGTPNAGHLEWLRWRAAELLHRATRSHEKPKAAIYDPADSVWVITGICWPHAVVDCNAWPAAEKAGLEVGFVMLDVRRRVIAERLTARDPERKGLKALVRYNRQLADVLRRQVAQQRRGLVLEVGHMTPAETAAEILQWSPTL